MGKKFKFSISLSSRKRKIVAYVLAITAFTALFFQFLPSKSVDAGDKLILQTDQVVDKVTICHRTAANPNANNPYNQNNVSVSSIFKKKGHDSHVGPIWYPGIDKFWGDIIPPFSYKDKDDQIKHYEGLNWPEGEAIWNNDCKYIPQEEDILKVLVKKSVETTCEEDGSNIQVLYTITGTNVGNIPAQITKVKDVLDPKVSCSQISDYSIIGTCDSGKILWNFNNVWLGVGKSKSLSYKVTIDKEDYGTYDNKAVIYYGEDQIARSKLSETFSCDIPEEPQYCLGELFSTYGDWSTWTVDPNDDTKEISTRTVYYWDAEDKTKECGTSTETQSRDIPVEEEYPEDEPEVLGASTTTLVSADTAGGSVNPMIALIEFSLVILTGISFIYLGKKELHI